MSRLLHSFTWILSQYAVYCNYRSVFQLKPGQKAILSDIASDSRSADLLKWSEASERSEPSEASEASETSELSEPSEPSESW